MGGFVNIAKCYGKAIAFWLSTKNQGFQGDFVYGSSYFSAFVVWILSSKGEFPKPMLSPKKIVLSCGKPGESCGKNETDWGNHGESLGEFLREK
ncbi:hypothetical protein AWQ21_11355 [Picosynechococcus sp. PCC 7003]|nr:hypothetical protein AWQ21_11355 [Picosynechococcus sp. PCC 7003]